MERTNNLDNPLRPSAFTTEELWILHVAVQKYGPDFKLIRELHFRSFSEAKLKLRFAWQSANGWNDEFFVQYFPLLQERNWECKGTVLNQSRWNGFQESVPDVNL